MTTRTKSLGLAAAVTAIALSIPTAVNAFAEPTPTPKPTPPPFGALSTNAPEPQGPECGTYKETLPSGSFAGTSALTASAAIASIPELSTFSQAISGQVNPAVNLAGVLDNGPYNVFAPTNEAFAKMEPGELELLKSNPEELTSVLYYHMALGYLGPDIIKGKLTSQQGSQLTVTGSGGDIKVDDVAKVVCGGITAQSAKIYMIDTVLNPAESLPGTATTTTSPTETATSPTETSSTETTEPAPVPTESLPAEATATTVPVAPA
ncbi:fasciclin [Mycobacterium sp. MS1601]|uniref:fasciclin domain-containing protein n=1 Tax=Mycobacterium sp. MS1601 TaxID=1936029 RepID=UPI00097913A7|nr:fasciclin domain-containing protein [Mycobacterium sp. MS1601]AQA04021.1 fasciclin [Mycobacterium sp. MS1601]